MADDWSIFEGHGDEDPNYSDIQKVVCVPPYLNTPHHDNQSRHEFGKTFAVPGPPGTGPLSSGKSPRFAREDHSHGGVTMVPMTWNRPGIVALATSDYDYIDYEAINPATGYRLVIWDVDLTTAPSGSSIQVKLYQNTVEMAAITVPAGTRKIRQLADVETPIDSTSWGAPGTVASAWTEWNVQITNIGGGNAAGLVVKAWFRPIVL